MKLKTVKSDSKTEGVEVEFLGCGGAFDVNQGNSSAVLTSPKGEKLLIDCGSLVFKEILNRNLAESINHVIITHTHDDHIGSLSAFIYLKWFVLKTPLKIYCSEDVSKKLSVFLLEVSGHEKEQFVMHPMKIGTKFTPIKEVEAGFFDVTKYHVSNLPNAGVVFQISDFRIVYSSDTNKFVMNLIEESHKPLYDSLSADKDNVLIFHDVSKYCLPGNSVHIFYEELAEQAKEYKNLFVYHHSKEDADFMKSAGFPFTSINRIKGKKLTINN